MPVNNHHGQLTLATPGVLRCLSALNPPTNLDLSNQLRFGESTEANATVVRRVLG